MKRSSSISSLLEMNEPFEKEWIPSDESEDLEDDKSSISSSIQSDMSLELPVEDLAAEERARNRSEAIQVFILKRMKQAGFLPHEYIGICGGFATTAALAYEKNNIAFFSEPIEILLNLTQEEFTFLLSKDKSELTPLELENKNAILGLFNLIKLYQDPARLEDVFEKLVYPITHIEKISELIEMEPAERLTSMVIHTNIYDIHSLKKYLDLLQARIVEDTTFILCSRDHAVNIRYRVNDQTWVFLDRLTGAEVLGREIRDTAELANYIFGGFEDAVEGALPSFTGFSTFLCAKQAKRPSAERFIAELHASQEFRELNDTSEEKLEARVNVRCQAQDDSCSWLWLASRCNDSCQVRYLLATGKITLKEKMKVLDNAICLGCDSIVEICLQEKVPINSNSLAWAVMFKNNKMITLLVVAGGRSDYPEVMQEAWRITEEYLNQKTKDLLAEMTSLSTPILPRTISAMLRSCFEGNEQMTQAFLTNSRCRDSLMQQDSLAKPFRELLSQRCAEAIQPAIKKIKADSKSKYYQKHLLTVCITENCLAFGVTIEEVMKKTYTGKMSNIDAFCDKLLESGDQVKWFIRPTNHATFFRSSSEQAGEKAGCLPSRSQ